MTMTPTMIAALVWLLCVLVGDRLRLRPPPRRPVALTGPDNEWAGRTGGAGLAGWVGRFTTDMRRRRADDAAVGPEHVAVWCDGLARSIRSGSTLASAITDVEPPPPCAETVESIRLAMRRGVSLRQACAIEPCPADLTVALTVIRVCAEHGGPAAEPLSRAAATMRGRAAEAADRRTQSAQARMSAVVMTVLPICMLCVLLATSGSVRLFVVSPAGFGVVAVGSTLNLIGWQWMRRLVGGGLR